MGAKERAQEGHLVTHALAAALASSGRASQRYACIRLLATRPTPHQGMRHHGLETLQQSRQLWLRAAATNTCRTSDGGRADRPGFVYRPGLPARARGRGTHSPDGKGRGGCGRWPCRCRLGLRLERRLEACCCICRRSGWDSRLLSGKGWLGETGDGGRLRQSCRFSRRRGSSCCRALLRGRGRVPWQRLGSGRKHGRPRSAKAWLRSVRGVGLGGPQRDPAALRGHSPPPSSTALPAWRPVRRAQREGRGCGAEAATDHRCWRAVHALLRRPSPHRPAFASVYSQRCLAVKQWGLAAGRLQLRRRSSCCSAHACNADTRPLTQKQPLQLEPGSMYPDPPPVLRPSAGCSAAAVTADKRLCCSKASGARRRRLNPRRGGQAKVGGE